MQREEVGSNLLFCLMFVEENAFKSLRWGTQCLTPCKKHLNVSNINHGGKLHVVLIAWMMNMPICREVKCECRKKKDHTMYGGEAAQWILP